MPRVRASRAGSQFANANCDARWTSVLSADRMRPSAQGQNTTVKSVRRKTPGRRLVQDHASGRFPSRSKRNRHRAHAPGVFIEDDDPHRSESWCSFEYLIKGYSFTQVFLVGARQQAKHHPLTGYIVVGRLWRSEAQQIVARPSAATPLSSATKSDARRKVRPPVAI
jgi:hypothetical protein